MYSYSLIFHYSSASTDNYVTKYLLIEANIRRVKRIEKSPAGVPIRKWVIAVQEAGYVLGHLVANTASTPSLESWFFFKAKFEVLEMQASSTKAGIVKILADIPKGDRNLTPIENQY